MPICQGIGILLADNCRNLLMDLERSYKESKGKRYGARKGNLRLVRQEAKFREFGLDKSP